MPRTLKVPVASTMVFCLLLSSIAVTLVGGFFTAYAQSGNQPPTANDDQFVYTESSDFIEITFNISTDLLANDTDPDSDPLTLVAYTSAEWGEVEISDDETELVYSLNMEHWTEDDEFTYTISDGQLEDTATVSIDVTVDNAGPTAINDAYDIPADGSTTVLESVLANDTDPNLEDYDWLTAELVTGPTDGTLTLEEDGTFTYTPDPGFTGTDSFTYDCSDTAAVTSTATVTLTVHGSNTTPFGATDTYVLPANTNLNTLDEYSLEEGVLANDYDVENNPLVATLVGNPTSGEVEFLPDGNFYYKPDIDFHGTDSFTYEVSDGESTSSAITVNLTVDNEAPIAQNDAYDIPHDWELHVNTREEGVLSNDSDNDNLVDGCVYETPLPECVYGNLLAQLVTGPSHGTLTLEEDGRFHYVPNPGYVGLDSFTYQASDNMETSFTTTVDIDVTNQAPVASDAYYQVVQDVSLTADAAGGVLKNDADHDDDTLTATLVAGPSNGSLNTFNSDGSFTYVPDTGYTGSDSFTYDVSDGIATTGPITVHLDVVAAAPSIEVSVTATDDQAYKGYDDAASVDFTRTGDLTNGLTVDYAISGDATNGDDYLHLTGQVYFPPQVDTVPVDVMPVDNGDTTPVEFVMLTLQPKSNYKTQMQGDAVVLMNNNVVTISYRAGWYANERDLADNKVKVDNPPTTNPPFVSGNYRNLIHNPTVVIKEATTDDYHAAIFEIGINTQKILEGNQKVGNKFEDRLEWIFQPKMIDGKQGAVAFHKRNGYANGQEKYGRSVAVRGTQEGGIEVRLKLKNGPTFKVDEVYVVNKLVEIPYRVNLFKEPLTLIQTDFTPEEVLHSIAVANVILRQIGVKFVPDTNTNKYTHANLRRNGPNTPHVFRNHAYINLLLQPPIGYKINAIANFAANFQVETGLPFVRNVHFQIPGKGRAFYTMVDNVIMNSHVGMGAVQINFAESGEQRDKYRANAVLLANTWVDPSAAKKKNLKQFTYGGETLKTVEAPNISARAQNDILGMVIYNSVRDKNKKRVHFTLGKVIVHEMLHVFFLAHRGKNPTLPKVKVDGLDRDALWNVMSEARMGVDIDLIQFLTIKRNELYRKYD